MNDPIPEIVACELYTDCASLPLFNWIKLAVTGDLKWLIKSGKTGEDLSEIYQAILAEHRTLVKDSKSTHELKLKVSISTLSNRIDNITIAVAILRGGRDERIIHLLQNELGFYRLTYDDLQKDLDLTETLLRSDIIKLRQKQQQYTDMIGGDNEEQINDEAAFYEEISIVEKWKGYAINPNTTSILQYEIYLNQLNAEIKQNQARENK